MLHRKILSLCMLAAMVHAGRAQSGFEHTVIRDIKAPLIAVFDPMLSEDNWVAAQPAAMPEHAPGSEDLRKRIDAARMSRMKGPMNRGNYSGRTTNPSFIAPVIDGSYNGGGGGGTPNDNHVAVGNDGKFINVLNTTIRVHSADGPIVRSWSLENFVNNPGIKIDPIPTLTRVYDPRVLYDPIADRYIIVYMHGTTDVTSFIVVAFSTSSDPLKPWNVYKIPGKPTNDLIWSDYPIVAHNSEDLFFTVNLIGNGASWEEGFTEAVIWQIRKEDGYQGDTLHKNVYTGIKYEGKALRSICAIQNNPMPTGTDNYFITVRPLAEQNDTVFMLRVNNTQKSGLADLETKVLRSEVPYGFPPSALQPDTSYKLRTNDCRALTGIRTGNTVQFLQNTMNFSTMQAHLTHSTVYNIDGNAFIRGGLITDDSLDLGYPAIVSASTKDGEASSLITFVYSSPWHYPGTAVMYRNRYGEYSDIVKVKQGQSLIYYNYIPKGEQRWGDYEGIQAKYNEPGVYYLVGSYSINSSMAAWVARITINDTVYNQPVSHVRVFPVPAQSDIFTEIQVTQEGKYSISLYNTLGQKVKDKPAMELSAGTHLLRIDPNSVAPGEYIIHVIAPDSKIIHKEKIIIL